MISRQDLERLVQRQNGDSPVLSLFLDMSVDSNNKRNHGVFLNQKRAELEDRENRTVGGNGSESGYGGLFQRISLG